MNVQGVMTLLEKHKNERGIEHWKRLTGGEEGEVPRDRPLAAPQARQANRPRPRAGDEALGERLLLNKRALAAVKSYWPIEVDYGDNSCEPVDVIKHLTGPHIQAKVAQA